MALLGACAAHTAESSSSGAAAGGTGGMTGSATASNAAATGTGGAGSMSAAGGAGGGGPASCSVDGNPGKCIDVGSCAAIGDHSSYKGYCAGPSSIECCVDTPDVADNPPLPMGWTLMKQADVTTDMTSWAVLILKDPGDFPMYATTTKTFMTKTSSSQLVMARVEWHPPDFQNGVVHRGVTLYVPG